MYCFLMFMTRPLDLILGLKITLHQLTRLMWSVGADHNNREYESQKRSTAAMQFPEQYVGVTLPW